MSSLASSDTAVVRSDKFEETQFLRDLVNLKDTQEAIQSLSLWCLKNRKKKLILYIIYFYSTFSILFNRRYAYKIARCWLKVSRKVRTEQKLTLFHLINDVVQVSYWHVLMTNFAPNQGYLRHKRAKKVRARWLYTVARPLVKDVP